MTQSWWCDKDVFRIYGIDMSLTKTSAVSTFNVHDNASCLLFAWTHELFRIWLKVIGGPKDTKISNANKMDAMAVHAGVLKP